MQASQHYVHIVYRAKIMRLRKKRCVERSRPIILCTRFLKQKYGEAKNRKSHELKNHCPRCDHAGMVENCGNRNTADCRKSGEELRGIFPSAVKNLNPRSETGSSDFKLPVLLNSFWQTHDITSLHMT